MGFSSKTNRKCRSAEFCKGNVQPDFERDDGIREPFIHPPVGCIRP